MLEGLRSLRVPSRPRRCGWPPHRSESLFCDFSAGMHKGGSVLRTCNWRALSGRDIAHELMITPSIAPVFSVKADREDPSILGAAAPSLPRSVPIAVQMLEVARGVYSRVD
jgi:hypothetical protein